MNYFLFHYLIIEFNQTKTVYLYFTRNYHLFLNIIKFELNLDCLLDLIQGLFLFILSFEIKYNLESSNEVYFLVSIHLNDL